LNKSRNQERFTCAKGLRGACVSAGCIGKASKFLKGLTAIGKIARQNSSDYLRNTICGCIFGSWHSAIDRDSW